MAKQTFDLAAREFDDATEDVHEAVRDWADRNNMEWFDETDSLDERSRENGKMRTLVKVRWNKHITVDEFGNFDLEMHRRLSAEDGELRVTDKSLIVDTPSEDRTRTINADSFPIAGR